VRLSDRILPETPLPLTLTEEFTLPWVGVLYQVMRGISGEYGSTSTITIDGTPAEVGRTYARGSHIFTAVMEVRNPPTGWWNLWIYPGVRFRELTSYKQQEEETKVRLAQIEKVRRGE
jgi:hypothetical protein